jgi:hypothetical protein
MSHFSGHFEGASTFLLRSGQFKGSKKSWPPQNALEMAHKVILPPKKNYIPQFLKQRDINSYSLFNIFT